MNNCANKKARHLVGLFIEMKKAKGGQTSDKQDAMMAALDEQGYYTIVCHGWVEAKQAIEAYLGNRKQ